MTYHTPTDVVLAIMEAYFHTRKAEAVMDCLAEDIVWVGMEAGEFYHGSDAVRAMLQEDIAAHPDAFDTEMNTLPALIERKEGWVTAYAKGERKLDETHHYTVRATAECVLTEKGWLICVLHTSVPNMAMEQFRLQLRLNEEQHKQEMLMRGIPGGVAIYRLREDGTVPTDYVSEGLAQCLGYTAEEFLAVLRDNSLVNLVPEDIPEVMEKVMACLPQHSPISIAYRVYNKAHQPVHIRLDANFIDDPPKAGEVATVYAVHTLVTEDAEVALQEQALYRSLLDNLDVAFFEYNEDGTFYASESFARYAASQIDPALLAANCGPLDMVHPDDLPLLRQFFEEAGHKVNKHSVTLRCKMTDGSYRWTEMTGIYIYNPDGTPARQIGVIRDAENEWIEQNKRLTEALETAKQASRSKTDFFSRVSHDIRTPLNAILGFARMAMTSPEQAGDYLQKILSSGEYLLNLVNDVLSMSKIENQSFTLNEEPANVKAFLTDIADMFEQEAAQYGVRLVSDFSQTRTDWVLIDRLRLKQVYSNLLNNAIKFSPSGSTIHWTVIHRPMDNNVMNVVSTIRDEGCGMSEAFLQQLFQPFAQERNPYSDKLPGTGLGLAIVKSLMDSMHADIQVESKLGVGTTVTLHFHRTMSQQPAAISDECSAKDETTLSGKRVLLCEDHPLNREIAEYLLKGKGMVVEEAENGRIGLDTFAASPVGWFDGILMDIRMPEMDGITCTKRIRALDREDALRIPIIAMTANAYAEDIQAVLAAGMNAHIAKPVEPKLFFATLAKWMA